MTSTYLWNPPPVYSLPVRGKTERLPVNRIFFVGRNYHAHAVEKGRPVDKSVEVPFYFTKAPGTRVESGATVAYPPETKNYHFEMELVLAIAKPGFRVGRADLDDAAVAALVNDYVARARCEEAEFLPLSQEIPGRNSNRMAALGMSLHLRHAVPQLLKDSGLRG